ncbi:MAG: DUF177 domain-containing protein [Lachnospiraceae bacterium]|nr:DUF177 domain-containing protein [Lachnospiraceae bacterium]
MLVNLTDILTSEDKAEDLLIDYEPDTFTAGGRTFPIISKEPFQLVCRNTGKGKAMLTGSFSCELLMECDRCLKDVKVPFRLEPEENISIEEIEHPADADSLSFMEGYQLDTEKLLGNEILVNWPTKVLCRDDCKGICKLCGKDLNLGDCGCDTFIPDPRMAVINDIFNANKEV